MNVTLLLCDFAQVADGKLSVLGAGWVLKGHGSPMAVGAVVEVPWDETNQLHPWTLRLLDADGHEVTIVTEPGGEPQPLQVGGQIEVGRPPGYPVGTPLNVALAVNFGPLPLPAAQRFSVVMELDGLPADRGQVSFSTASTA